MRRDHKDQSENKWNRNQKKRGGEINETKSWFFEMINKIDKTAWFIKEKNKGRAQVNKIRNEKDEVTNYTTVIKKS